MQIIINRFPQYNGNISVMGWRTGNDVHRGYVYAYDGLNRMKQGRYFEFGARYPSKEMEFTNGPSYDESFTYDKKGNILTLVRTGLADVHNEMREAPHVPGGPPCAGYVCAVHRFGEIDNLKYTRSRDQLRRINDSATDPLYEGAFDFTDAVDEGIEYRYDANGNPVQDKNKGIEEITWNALQLPQKITFKNGHRIEYTYDALGVKHQVRYITAEEPVSMVMGNTIAGSTPRTESTEVLDYCGETIYRDGKITIMTENGYIAPGSNGRFTYHTYLSDHQGNIRGVLDNKGSLLQVNHYYPSGLSFAEKTGAEIQTRKYTGKELDRTHGVNIYDYGWRMYDPAIMEWWGVDKLTEKDYSTSPYVFCTNNPVNRIDLDGKTDYELTPLGQIIIKGKPNNNLDRLFAGNKYINVADKELLSGLTINRGGDYYKRRFYKETFNLNDATNVFKFVSDNTNKEWKLDVYEDKQGHKKAVIATDMAPSSVSSTTMYHDEEEGSGANTKDHKQLVDIHSHPDDNGTKGGSSQDMSTSLDNGKNAVYHKKTQTLYEYDKTHQNFNSISTNSYKNILDYIK